jgi:PIN domain nuclease of toxin-antitoxin system
MSYHAVENGGTVEDVRAFFQPLPIRFRTFREEQAEEIGRLRVETRHGGLSVGDRACLALARYVTLPVLAADTKWLEIDLGIDIRPIR